MLLIYKRKIQPNAMDERMVVIEVGAFIDEDNSIIYYSIKSVAGRAMSLVDDHRVPSDRAISENFIGEIVRNT